MNIMLTNSSDFAIKVELLLDEAKRKDLENSELKLAIVDREMKMAELSKIVGVSPHGIRKWDNKIRNGIRLSAFLQFVVENKPAYRVKIEEYINKQVNRKLSLLEIKKE